MELINSNLIKIDSQLKNKEDVIKVLATLLYQDKRINSIEHFISDIYKREEELSTSMGVGVAIPHTQSTSVTHASLIFIKLKQEIAWGKDTNIKLIFGIAVPKENENNCHLKILSTLARKLMDDSFREELCQLSNEADTLQFLKFINKQLS